MNKQHIENLFWLLLLSKETLVYDEQKEAWNAILKEAREANAQLEDKAEDLL